MNKYIVAIGGGDIGAFNTLSIDKEIISLAGKKHPLLLFIPTASSDAKPYVKIIEKVYGEKLGCTVDALYLLDGKTPAKDIQKKILSANIIYVGGGNTLKMMKLWRKLGVDKLLKKAYKKGIVLCGLSAGAICWFEYGHSDSLSFYDPNEWEYVRVKGLGLIPGLACPHYNGQTKYVKRKTSFKEMVQKTGDTGIGIENKAAIIFRDGVAFKVINSRKGAKAYKVVRKQGKVVSTALVPRKEFLGMELIY